MICSRCKKTFDGNLERCPIDGAPVCEQEDLARIGARLGNYELTEILGLGGMGVVYRAIHLLLDKPVAVKILCTQYSRRRCHPEDILREARAASRIRHRHVVDVTDFGLTEDGAAYMVMELLEGETLAKLIARSGRLSQVRVARIVRQLASALAAAHALGIIHRDLKPENIYLLPPEPGSVDSPAVDQQERDFVKVTDFGLAKVIDMEPSSRTREGIIAGTPIYMSPEHARCEVVDGRSDIYSLGVVFYQMATGVLPFTGRSALDYLMAHVSQAAMPPNLRCSDIGEELSAIIMRCLEKDPRHRYSTMEELRQDLREYLIGQGREVSVNTAENELPPPTAKELLGFEEQLEALPRSADPDFSTDEDRTLPPHELPTEVISSYSADDETLPPEPGIEPARFAADEETTNQSLSPVRTDEIRIELPASRRRRRALQGVVVVAAVLIAAGVSLAVHYSKNPPRSRPAPMVRVELPGLPARALTYVDGQLRAERPLVLPRSDRHHRLRIEADGYLTEEQTIRALGDQRLPVHLRLRAAPASELRASVTEASPPEIKHSKAARRRPATSRVTPRPRPAPAAAVEASEKIEERPKPDGKPVAKPAPRPRPGKKNDPDWVIDPD